MNMYSKGDTKMTKIYEAKTKQHGKMFFGYSYETPLFALADLINKSIDAGVKLSVKKDFQVTELIEDEKTQMLTFIPFSNLLNIKGSYNFVQNYLEVVEQNKKAVQVK